MLSAVVGVVTNNYTPVHICVYCVAFIFSKSPKKADIVTERYMAANAPININLLLVTTPTTAKGGYCYGT